MSRVRLSDGNRCYEHTQNPRAKAYIEVSFFKREGSPDDDNLREIPLYVPPTRCATRVASCSPAAAAAVAYTTPATSASMQVAAGNFPNSRHPDVKGRPGSSFSLPRGATATGQFLGKQRSSSDPGSTRDMQTPISFGDFQSPDSPIELRCIEPRPQKRGGSLSIGADSMGALGFPMKSVVFVGHRIGAYSLSPSSDYGVRERILTHNAEVKKEASSSPVTKKRKTAIGRDAGSPRAIARVASGNSIHDLGGCTNSPAIGPASQATQEPHPNSETNNPPVLLTRWRVTPASRKLLTGDQPPSQGPEPAAVSTIQKTDKPGQDPIPKKEENSNPKAPCGRNREPTGRQGARQRERKELAMKGATKVKEEEEEEEEEEEAAIADSGRNGVSAKPTDPPSDSREGRQGGGAGKQEQLWRIPRESAPHPDKPTVPMHFNGLVIIEYLEQVAMADLLETLRHKATHLPPSAANHVLEEAFLHVRKLMERYPLMKVTKELCEIIIDATLERYPKPELTAENLGDRKHTRVVLSLNVDI